jgi:hypothetical protein
MNVEIIELIRGDEELRCGVCGRRPHEIGEYETIEDREPGTLSPEEVDDIVRREEGTFNPFNNLFWCTSCYINLGLPLGTVPGVPR